jgi:hypothetical protein
MVYGHAERNLALLRQLEAETRQLLERLDQPDPEQSAWLQEATTRRDPLLDDTAAANHESSGCSHVADICDGPAPPRMEMTSPGRRPTLWSFSITQLLFPPRLAGTRT